MVTKIKEAEFDPPGPSKEALDYVELEMESIMARAEKLSVKLKTDKTPIFYAFVNLYINYYK
jgi:hypothetical protein